MIEGQKFPLGQMVITKGASETLDSASVQVALRKHMQGDWGIVCKEDKQANDNALLEGERLFSIYLDSNGAEFYIITERDRSVTTILLSSEY